MSTIPIQGHIDDQHRLSALVPETVPPGPVTVWLRTEQEDDAGVAWAAGVAQHWADELADPQQDIYTLADGEDVDPS